MQEIEEQKIILVEDDQGICGMVRDYLRGESFQVDVYHKGEAALRAFADEDYVLALVDLMLPDMSGMEVIRAIRKSSSLPIIIITAKDADTDKVMGLNVGADDYVTKPFNPLELVARVSSQLRRYTQLGAVSRKKENVYETGGLSMDDDRKEVRVDGELVKLTPIEYRILLFLVKNKGRVFSINQIYENIWNEEAIAADNTVAVHIRHIREKIEINPKEPRYLKVVWGLGYKVEKI